MLLPAAHCRRPFIWKPDGCLTTSSFTPEILTNFLIPLVLSDPSSQIPPWLHADGPSPQVPGQPATDDRPGESWLPSRWTGPAAAAVPPRGVSATQTLTRHLRELERSRSRGTGVSVDALTSALRLWAGENTGPQRARRSPSFKDCEQGQEQSVYNNAQMLPGVGTFYSLGTAVYYAVRNCPDVAKERGRDGVIDLGYDLLMAMAGASGGPTGLTIGIALKPALKAGVQRLIQYYYEREANTPPPETSEEVLGSTSDMSEVEETTVMAPFVSEVVSPNPCWGWTLFNNCGLDPRYWNIRI